MNYTIAARLEHTSYVGRFNSYKDRETAKNEAVFASVFYPDLIFHVHKF